MPTYEYICSECGVFEEFHSINHSLTACPRCHGDVKKLISQNSSIIFKGSGFHSTDYRSGDYQKKVGKETEKQSTAAQAKKTEKAS